MHLLIRFIVNAIVLWLVISLVPGFHNNAGQSGFGAYSIGTIVILAIIFGLVNMLIGPILRLLSAPITWLTHGLFQVVINWILLGLAVWIAPNVKGGWLPTLIGAIVLMIVGTLIAMASNPERTSTV
ncbi:MAG: phage holin family protein [Candidatus Eremiobacteraeota bacterium]|nr:phage holin family protein [Candidatus Eremiobacteraeota bacterium]MBV9262835.1 phage holin family protein [Candidatus Eremiobacteraeota bacterium]